MPSADVCRGSANRTRQWRTVCSEQVPGVFRLFRTQGMLLGDPLARSSDGELCRRAAMLLNRVDPGAKMRVRSGIGWW